MLEHLIEQLRHEMTKSGYSTYMIERAEKRVKELQQRDVNCVDRFVRRLLSSVNGKEAYLDILMEGRFAVILARNGFKEIYIEYCTRGPDIKAKYNRQTIYFEVTRRHANENEWAKQDEAGFESPDRIENVIARIQGKLRQLHGGGINIIVLWSDTVILGRFEVEEAFNHILQEDQNTGAYKDLSGVLLTEGGGVEVASMKQFYLFQNNKALKPVGTRLDKKLESLHERDIKALKKELEDLTATIKQLRTKGNL